MQVLEQHGGAGPSDRQEASMVGERLRLVPQRKRTIQGVEAVHLIRKGRVRRVAKHDSLAQARFISTLFGVAI
jgi:hypothetical protein